MRSNLESRQSEDNACLRQILVQIHYSSTGTKIQVGNGATIDDQPVYGRWRIVHKFAYLFCEECDVGIKEIRPEPIHDHARHDHPARHGLLQLPMIHLILNHHPSVRAVTTADVLQQ